MKCQGFENDCVLPDLSILFITKSDLSEKISLIDKYYNCFDIDIKIKFYILKYGDLTKDDISCMSKYVFDKKSYVGIEVISIPEMLYTPNARHILLQRVKSLMTWFVDDDDEPLLAIDSKISRSTFDATCWNRVYLLDFDSDNHDKSMGLGVLWNKIFPTWSLKEHSGELIGRIRHGEDTLLAYRALDVIPNCELRPLQGLMYVYHNCNSHSLDNCDLSSAINRFKYLYPYPADLKRLSEKFQPKSNPWHSIGWHVVNCCSKFSNNMSTCYSYCQVICSEVFADFYEEIMEQVNQQFVYLRLEEKCDLTC